MENTKHEIIIKVTDQAGHTHLLESPVDMGLSLKDICKAYELPMEATCGGMAMCATCHCFVTSDRSHLPAKSEEEEALLSELFTTQENSRLACQIRLTAALDGLSIQLPVE